MLGSGAGIFRGRPTSSYIAHLTEPVTYERPNLSFQPCLQTTTYICLRLALSGKAIKATTLMKTTKPSVSLHFEGSTHNHSKPRMKLLGAKERTLMTAARMWPCKLLSLRLYSDITPDPCQLPMARTFLLLLYATCQTTKPHLGILRAPSIQYFTYDL